MCGVLGRVMPSILNSGIKWTFLMVSFASKLSASRISNVLKHGTPICLHTQIFWTINYVVACKDNSLLKFTVEFGRIEIYILVCWVQCLLKSVLSTRLSRKVRLLNSRCIVSIVTDLISSNSLKDWPALCKISECFPKCLTWELLWRKFCFKNENRVSFMNSKIFYSSVLKDLLIKALKIYATCPKQVRSGCH